jgi:hypothetical protein
MKYSVSKCPTCGGTPVAELNRVPVLAGLIENDDGGFDYSGNGKVDWNTQEVWPDVSGLTALQCAGLHWWQTGIESEPAT